MTLKEQCDKWDQAMKQLRHDEDCGIYYAPPVKPPGYDLHRQGDNPLKLHVKTAWSNPLFPPAMVSDAKPIPLDAPKLRQQNLPL